MVINYIDSIGWLVDLALLLIIEGDPSENRFGIPPIGSKSNHSSAARAARSTDPSPSAASSREESPSESRAARAARFTGPSPSESTPSESRAARAARSTDSSPSAASSTNPKDLYFDNERSPSKKNPPDEPVKKDSSQENPSKDVSSEADDLVL